MFTLTLFLAACSVEVDPVAAVMNDLDRMGHLVDEHAAAVRASASLTDAMALEEEHDQDMNSLMDELDHSMGDASGCRGMSDARFHQAEMEGEFAHHHDSHAEHPDLAACQAAEDVYQAAMHDDLDAMADHMAADEACGEGRGMGMM